MLACILVKYRENAALCGQEAVVSIPSVLVSDAGQVQRKPHLLAEGTAGQLEAKCTGRGGQGTICSPHGHLFLSRALEKVSQSMETHCCFKLVLGNTTYFFLHSHNP